MLDKFSFVSRIAAEVTTLKVERVPAQLNRLAREIPLAAWRFLTFGSSFPQRSFFV